MTSPNERRRAAIAGWLLGSAGALASIAGVRLAPGRMSMSWLVAYVTIATAALGALALIMIARVTGARWFDGLRPVAVGVTASFPMLVLLFAPILLSLSHLYPWADPAQLSESDRLGVEHVGGWLSAPAFALRAVLCLTSWLVLAWLMHRLTAVERAGHLAGDGSPAPRAAIAGLVVLAITLTLAAFDWMMATAGGWHSSIYPLFVFAGCMVAALSALAAAAPLGNRLGFRRISSDELHALGKLLLTFILFWAYTGYSQLLIIWSGDIPREVTWYVARLRGSWGVVGFILVIGHCILFLLLLTRAAKRSPTAMSLVGIWLLLLHWLNIYWLLMPETAGASALPSWTDFAALAAVIGLAIGSALTVAAASAAAAHEAREARRAR